MHFFPPLNSLAFVCPLLTSCEWPSLQCIIALSSSCPWRRIRELVFTAPTFRLLTTNVSRFRSDWLCTACVIFPVIYFYFPVMIITVVAKAVRPHVAPSYGGQLQVTVGWVIVWLVTNMLGGHSLGYDLIVLAPEHKCWSKETPVGVDNNTDFFNLMVFW